MDDGILRAIVCDGQAALVTVNASKAGQKAGELLDLSDGVQCALSRLICAAAMLSQRNKEESEKLTLIVNGGGSAGKLLVTADNRGFVKACADEPRACAPTGSIDLPALVGKDGQMTVVRDNPLGKEPYVGVCNLVSGDITRDFAAYLVTSEQQPAAVALDAGLEDGSFCAGGMMVLPLPGCSEAALNEIEKKISACNDLLHRLTYHLSLKEMVLDMFWDVGVKPLEDCPLEYHCDCSRERFESALLSLGRNELLSMAYDKKDTEIVCRFCRKKYIFTPNELKAMLKGSSHD